MNDSIIKFDNFTFQYNAQSSPTLKNISLEIKKGEKVLIVGPSGCGKSTLAHCINGLIPFSYQGEASGSLTIAGRESRDMSIFELSKTVGTVLQDSDGQFVGLTVAEDIAFALENDCIVGQELYSRVKNAAKKVNIQDFLHHAPTELSGGQKQRVSLAGIIVDDVDVLLFDEPLANLDPATGKSAIELIDEVQQQTQTAVIIIEHRLEDVLWRHVDRIVLMQQGQILADMTPDELLSTDLLEKNGIREPLYITALKYAGVNITPRMHPWSISTLQLTESEKEKVRSWFNLKPETTKVENEEQLLKTTELDFKYLNGCHALKSVSISINKGELVAIVGTNGAGKSTFSKVVCGFETPQKGYIEFNGQDFSSFSIKERADHVGYVMQNPNQMISKTMIRDEIAMALQTRQYPEDEINERVDAVLKTCGLWPFRNWPISALSYGQKKRVTIASILALQPEMIILDEPTAGQDYHHYTDIMEFLLKLNKQGVTIVMITHDMHLMLEYARRSIVFNSGRVIADASGAKVLTSPDIIAQASLKETSLYALSMMCGIENAEDFVQCFIDYEREARLS